MAPARHFALPPTLAPRGLSREEAAAYIGVSAGLFDLMVSRREMPGPKKIGARRVWDRVLLDRAFAAIPSSGDDADAPSDGWDDFA